MTSSPARIEHHCFAPSDETAVVWIEPWGDQKVVTPGSKLIVVIYGWGDQPSTKHLDTRETVLDGWPGECAYASFLDGRLLEPELARQFNTFLRFVMREGAVNDQILAESYIARFFPQDHPKSETFSGWTDRTMGFEPVPETTVEQ